jgi:cation diffusion facilitator family transporter
MAGSGNKAVIAACIANFAIGVAKLVGFFFTGSGSMLAEAVHSAADTGNQLLLLYGSWRGKRQATLKHPFGYGRERYFWAFVVAVVLFVIGAAFALYEGIHKLQNPEPLEDPIVAVIILGVSVLLESWSFRTAIVEARLIKGKAAWGSFLRHTKSAELPVVLLEDLGALVGLLLALSGVLLTMLTGDARFDAAATLAIGGLLGVIAVFLAFEMHSLLIGEGASQEVLDAIVKVAEETPGVKRVVHMRTLHLAPEELLVAAKLEFSPTLTFAEVTAEIDLVEARIRAVESSARLIYIEPARVGSKDNDNVVTAGGTSVPPVAAL